MKKRKPGDKVTELCVEKKIKEEGDCKPFQSFEKKKKRKRKRRRKKKKKKKKGVFN